ncbi:hypothetical protein EXIGLDRAFT_750384 [Exidia glandulosa HHB12029]|uniref:Uncharacterized protein n=1 Tax=Exidia glandulosa HHB12029 TaxID=1314781 RepID=A0A165GTJ9_EXIGL|nr:hypothetical protein EXIGLDRAFT_750384 [Exidia glandulosa HHB12029]
MFPTEALTHFVAAALAVSGFAAARLFVNPSGANAPENPAPAALAAPADTTNASQPPQVVADVVPVPDIQAPASYPLRRTRTVYNTDSETFIYAENPFPLPTRPNFPPPPPPGPNGPGPGFGPGGGPGPYPGGGGGGGAHGHGRRRRRHGRTGAAAAAPLPVAPSASNQPGQTQNTPFTGTGHVLGGAADGSGPQVAVAVGAPMHGPARKYSAPMQPPRSSIIPGPGAVNHPYAFLTSSTNPQAPRAPRAPRNPAQARRGSVNSSQSSHSSHSSGSKRKRSNDGTEGSEERKTKRRSVGTESDVGPTTDAATSAPATPGTTPAITVTPPTPATPRREDAFTTSGVSGRPNHTLLTAAVGPRARAFDNNAQAGSSSSTSHAPPSPAVPSTPAGPVRTAHPSVRQAPYARPTSTASPSPRADGPRPTRRGCRAGRQVQERKARAAERSSQNGDAEGDEDENMDDAGGENES